MSDRTPVPQPGALANRSEEARAARARAERNKRVALFIGIIAVLVAIVTAGLWYSSDSGTTGDSSSVEVAAGDGSILVGSSTAPVKVLVYEDFACPACRALEDATRDFLRENAAKGTVQVEYRPVNLLTGTTYSARAMNVWAAVLENASPTDALKLHDLLYENQPAPAAAEQTTDADLAALVAEAGADDSAVTAAMTTRNKAFFAAAAAVTADQGITRTPTVLVDGRELTNMDVAQIVEKIEQAVGSGG